MLCFCLEPWETWLIGKSSPLSITWSRPDDPLIRLATAGRTDETQQEHVRDRVPDGPPIRPSKGDERLRKRIHIDRQADG
jgi:hypothetical protein